MKKVALLAVVVILAASLTGCRGERESTPTPDTTPPTISGVLASGIASTSAIITWTTDESATSQVAYGLTTSYGSTTALDRKLVTIHSINLTGLNENTTYHYRVESKDASENESVSGDYVFTTATKADTTPPVISEVNAPEVTSSTVTITWTTNEPATSQVEYGPTTSYGSTTTPDEDMVTSHSVILSGLVAGTTHHYRVKSRDASGNEQVSGDHTFVTSMPPDTNPPAISELVAFNVTTTTATISWITDEAATSQVEYGPDTSYGSITTLDGDLANSHSVILSGLTVGTTYHYRVRSKDAWDNEALSEDRVFSTALPVSIGEAEITGLVEVTVTGSGLAQITIDLQSTSDGSLQLLILPGTIFDAQNPETQDMIVTMAEEAYLYSYGESELLTVPVACMDMELDVPGETDAFTISNIPAPEDLIRLVTAADFPNETARVQQFAIWTITENPNCNLGYRGLSTIGPFGSGPSEDELARIRSLFGEAGISIDQYRALTEGSVWQLSSWAVVNCNNRACLDIDFAFAGYVGSSLRFSLGDPNGVEADWALTDNCIGDTKLEMAGLGEVPPPGEYVLTVTDGDDETIVTENFSFVGAEATISEVLLTWQYWETLGYYSLTGISFQVTNSGDLPAYVDTGRIILDGTETTRQFFDEPVLPGEEKTFEKSLYISEIEPGSKSFTLELQDNASTVVASYSVTVIPGQMTRSGHITRDETWAGTVHVTGEVFIEEGATVYVLPGTTVLFAAHQDDQHFGAAASLDEWIAQHNDPTWTQEYAESHIAIRGKMIAQGTAENMIVFTSDSPTPDAGDWLQLHPSYGSIFEYCIIEYCRAGISPADDTADSILISHNIIRHVLWTAVGIQSCSPTVTYNEIFHGGGHGGITVLGEGASPYIAYNTIKECKAGIGIFQGASPIVENNEFVDNDTVAIALNGASNSAIVYYNQISSPIGPSMHTTYQGEIIYPSNRLLGETYVSEGISIVNCSPTISNNHIFQCDNIGITIMGNSSPDINHNTIEGHNIGILFEQSFTGTPTIEMNNIFDNENCNIALRADGTIEAMNNWWGTTDPNEIQTKIVDVHGEPAIGRVAFEPFLSEPVEIV